ncbi:LiaF transmembrane domain-containing protein [Dyadobacter fermentans]|uniref:LiaF transmembrane domain-containing protein n=1 Tax=Dyadobacter fermentans (strain ATCC 700827 / DSM 18053 / CIP 107007 / KCTC 52180 / NS114) TaxID=471854 RepID=C6W4E0_DYAFD|nr:DUF5668 domain-containing protein [Dyadobacter fermentans]ACT94041.1 hypothetical protein Dfer_2826 [Dyadobacter fermentans DSM 18053]
MRNSRGIVWGGMLIILGVIWLLRSMDLLNIDWDAVLPYWPVLLILAGAILMAAGRERGSGGIVALLITLAVFGGIVNKTHQAIDDRDNWHFGWDDDRDYGHDRDDDDYDNDDSDRRRDEDYERDRRGGRPINGSYNYEMQDFIQKANFNLEGGAGSFSLDGNTPKLFEAATKSNVVGFKSTTSVNKLNNSASVSLKMEEGNVKIKNGEISNQAKIHLNDRPIWNIDLGIGAGKGNFDFSNYKVEKLKVSTGVADMDIRLSDKLPVAVVEIEAGVASVTLEVPESVGCEMRMDGALNAKNMEGLERVGNGHYRSSNYDTAPKKVIVHYEGGLTSINIKRY